MCSTQPVCRLLVCRCHIVAAHAAAAHQSWLSCQVAVSGWLVDKDGVVILALAVILWRVWCMMGVHTRALLQAPLV
jgi:hypothetical protein